VGGTVQIFYLSQYAFREKSLHDIAFDFQKLVAYALALAISFWGAWGDL